jgi:Glycosyl hydrolase catalytic core
VKRLAASLVLIASIAVAGATAQSAQPAPHMLVGIFDDAETLGHADAAFPMLKTLRTQVVRTTMYWGGAGGVAGKKRPAHPTDPSDPAYNWGAYDKMVRDAGETKIKVLFSIWGTPGWANKRKGLNHAPTLSRDLRNFAYAAAKRYSGTFVPDDGDTNAVDGSALPAVRLWLVWNEPGNPIFLKPQYKRVGTGKKRHWVAQSPIDYARMCTAVYTGVHATLLRNEKVACGATGPRGNNNPSSTRASIGPLPFLRGVKKAGLKKFDVWAHHPYYASPKETPPSKPTSNRGKRGRIAPPIVLGNIDELIKDLTRLYGRKRLWITEYGYQTNPPDRAFGVTWAKQAAYLRQAFAIARRNPRIDMMLWFLLRDEKRLGGWQSGLLTANGRKKPALNVFRALPH